jgi:RNA polymerase sporulation-specific sigma factor
MRHFQEKTQSEIADAIGVSQVQISRLEGKILIKMRNLMS